MAVPASYPAAIDLAQLSNLRSYRTFAATEPLLCSGTAYLVSHPYILQLFSLRSLIPRLASCDCTRAISLPAQMKNPAPTVQLCSTLYQSLAYKCTSNRTISYHDHNSTFMCCRKRTRPNTSSGFDAYSCPHLQSAWWGRHLGFVGIVAYR